MKNLSLIIGSLFLANSYAVDAAKLQNIASHSTKPEIKLLRNKTTMDFARIAAEISQCASLLASDSTLEKTKAADMLSQYYLKRAEQYHPVIQVGVEDGK